MTHVEDDVFFSNQDRTFDKEGNMIKDFIFTWSGDVNVVVDPFRKAGFTVEWNAWL